MGFITTFPHLYINYFACIHPSPSLVPSHWHPFFLPTVFHCFDVIKIQSDLPYMWVRRERTHTVFVPPTDYLVFSSPPSSRLLLTPSLSTSVRLGNLKSNRSLLLTILEAERSKIKITEDFSPFFIDGSFCVLSSFGDSLRSPS